MVLSEPTILLRVKFWAEIYGIFIRLLQGDPAIRINFARITDSISEGDYSSWENQRVAVSSKEFLTNKDILVDKRFGKAWRVMNIEHNEHLIGSAIAETDIGKDVEIRIIKHWEGTIELP
jgi:hypothetical protein